MAPHIPAVDNFLDSSFLRKKQDGQENNSVIDDVLNSVLDTNDNNGVSDGRFDAGGEESQLATGDTVEVEASTVLEDVDK